MIKPWNKFRSGDPQWGARVLDGGEHKMKTFATGTIVKHAKCEVSSQKTHLSLFYLSLLVLLHIAY